MCTGTLTVIMFGGVRLVYLQFVSVPLFFKRSDSLIVVRFSLVYFHRVFLTCNYNFKYILAKSNRLIVFHDCSLNQTSRQIYNFMKI